MIFNDSFREKTNSLCQYHWKYIENITEKMHTDLRVKGLSFQESIIIIYADMIFPRIDCVI